MKPDEKIQEGIVVDCDFPGGNIVVDAIEDDIEIPYANASGQAVTVETARAFGHDPAHALRPFLEDEPD